MNIKSGLELNTENFTLNSFLDNKHKEEYSNKKSGKFKFSFIILIFI